MSDELAARLRLVEAEGTGDVEGLALVRTLIERAESLPANGRARLLARAEALLDGYRERTPVIVPEPPSPPDDSAWREALAARAHARPPRVRTDERSVEIVSEIRATAASTRAAEQVPEAAGPYNGAAVAARALDELVAIAPGYVGSYIAWLEDLACLADLPAERRTARPKAAARRSRREP
ncbi:DUF2894 domain-containing protein [Sandaracinus amylolyticus]|uniref:DUF2894 domain-containing protein n=1 Tax=Sandaracinus amylolyticus TaxID=927083 RepID=UPI001F2F42C3|nr:DUF2894 domain-containing protein [Sandaracinus amylolyticus]UJR83232.1 Hypothetical protein I5071_52990 [Sandaracinus amylolyticus]